MVRELQPLDISAIPELGRLAVEVERRRRDRRLRLDDKDVAVLVPAVEPEPELESAPGPLAAKTGKRSAALLDAINAGYGSVPPLDPPRSLRETTEIAAAEHAERVARSGR